MMYDKKNLSVLNKDCSTILPRNILIYFCADFKRPLHVLKINLSCH